MKKYFKGIGIIILLLVGYFVVDNYFVNRNYRRTLNTAQSNYESSSIKLIEASLNLYYLDRNHYPLDTNILIEYLTNESKVNTIQQLKEVISKLNNFEYKTSGDGQKSQVSYLDYKNNQKVVEFNYKQDFR